jgi:energy-coupling factor transporter ATP-binding protein EcfA2
MNFEPTLFNPRSTVDKSFDAGDGSVGFRGGPKPEDTYIYPESVILALNVALATKRPLLISGEPGSGKTSLARNAAAVLGRVYYERVVTSRTQAADLLWNFDALRRLSDATAGGQYRKLPPVGAYVEPGPLWWAFDPQGAARRERKSFQDPGGAATTGSGVDAVLLLDEIDKADPDVPNDLLEPFGARTFTVRETGERVTAQREVLLMLTTNGERELPQAFLRRCVILALQSPSKGWFLGVAKNRLGQSVTAKLGERAGDLYDKIADKILGLRKAAVEARQRPPGTAEFLDAIEACAELRIYPGSDAFDHVVEIAAWKQRSGLGNSTEGR